MPQVDSEVVYVPMSYFEDGRTGYPVRYMKKDEIIVDILRQYDRFTKLVSDKNINFSSSIQKINQIVSNTVY